MTSIKVIIRLLNSHNKLIEFCIPKTDPKLFQNQEELTDSNSGILLKDSTIFREGFDDLNPEFWILKNLKEP